MTTTRRWLWRLASLAAAGVVALLLVTGPYQFVFGSWPAPRRRGGTPRACRAAQCTSSTARTSRRRRPPSVHYNSLPPTSGPHSAFTISTGVYTSPIPDQLTVHALEHGHVAIQYAPATPPAEVGALTRIARRYGADVVLAPYPRLRSGTALTAWGRLERLDHADQTRIVSFVEQLRGRYDHGWTRPDDCPSAARLHPRTGR